MRIHFVGIGGISMSALAKILHARGHVITGSDINPASIDGVETYIGHSVDNIKNPDLVVYTAAVKSDNPELRQARNLGIKILERSELLGEISAEFSDCIAVSGTHGKTTTCGMLTSVFMPLDPTVHMGGNYPLINGNVRLGGHEIFITEACEYVRSFLTLSVSTAIILNIAPDHLDYYKDIDDIKSAFISFSEKVREGGTVIVNGDNMYCRDIIESTKKTVITFGLNLDNDYSADDIFADESGYCSFNLIEKGHRKGRVTLGVRGTHNVLNALSVIACARRYSLDIEHIVNGLKRFTGVNRRFEFVGKINGAKVFLDYAHHPDEITSAIKTAYSLSPKKVTAVFQPHTYSRTKTLLDGFVKSLSLADEIIAADIYAAREKAIPGVTSRLLSQEISRTGKKSVNFHKFSDIQRYLEKHAKEGEIVMILGAGDIDKLADIFRREI